MDTEEEQHARPEFYTRVRGAEVGLPDQDFGR